MTLKELKKHLYHLAYDAAWYAERARYEKTRQKCIGRRLAYLNVSELLEQLDPDELRSKRRGHDI